MVITRSKPFGKAVTIEISLINWVTLKISFDMQVIVGV
jgi:hypothetical protein